MIISDTVTAPAHWACFLVYGDPSGMDPAEVAAAERFIAFIAPAFIVSLHGDDTRFAWSCPLAAGETFSGDVAYYTTHQLARRSA